MSAGAARTASAGTSATPSPAATQPSLPVHSAATKSIRGRNPAGRLARSSVSSAVAEPAMNDVVGQVGQPDGAAAGQAVAARHGHQQALVEQVVQVEAAAVERPVRRRR